MDRPDHGTKKYGSIMARHGKLSARVRPTRLQCRAWDASSARRVGLGPTRLTRLARLDHGPASVGAA
jgi:hypothetical protein